MYNQYENTETKYACSIVSLLHILLYRYAIEVTPNFMIRTAIFFDKLWKFDMYRGATFSVIDDAFVFALNWKLDLKFTIVENTVTNLQSSNKKTYQLWVKNYSTYKWNKIKQDWIIQKEDIDYLTKFSWNSGHALNYDWGYLIDTDGSKIIKMSLDVLKYWLEKDIFRDTIRTIEPENKFTKEVCKLTILMFQAEKKNKLLSFYKKNINNIYLNKAKELYFYGRN